MYVEASASSGNAIVAMQAGSAVYAKHNEVFNQEYILLEKAGKLAKKMVDVALSRTRTPDEHFEGFLNTLLMHHQEASEVDGEFNSIIP